MAYKMDYNAGVEFCKKLHASLSPSEKQNLHSKRENVYPNMDILYPGKKRPGDYLLKYNGHSPDHRDIAKHLRKLLDSEQFNFNQLSDLLSHVHAHGTNVTYSDNSLEKLQNLIFWATLQEEINYPIAEKKAGINLPFCRYFEAIYTTQPGCTFSIDEVLERCDNDGLKRPDLYPIPDSPNYYHY